MKSPESLLTQEKNSGAATEAKGREIGEREKERANEQPDKKQKLEEEGLTGSGETERESSLP